jgi:hypothetical protein
MLLRLHGEASWEPRTKPMIVNARADESPPPPRKRPLRADEAEG